MGWPKPIEDNPKRIATMKRLHKRSDLVDDNGVHALSDAQLLLKVNKAGPNAEAIGPTQALAGWR